MADMLVTASEASKEYGAGAAAVSAVIGATCSANAEARIALVGPSGSGKTTLLYMLGGLTAQTSGTIAWPALAPGKKLSPGHVAFVFQNPNLLAPLSVAENVAMPLLLAGIEPKDAASAARTALARLGIEELADKLPEELSGGQAQRVGIARAIAASPALILADEPTGQLDSATGARVIEELLAAADATHAALIIATHDERIAQRLSSRWTMRHGVLELSK